MSYRMDIFQSNTGRTIDTNRYLVDNTYVSGGGSNAASEIGNLLAGVVLTVAAAKAQGNQSAGAIKNANLQVSKAAQATIASYSSDMTTAMNNFTSKYAEFDVSISESGVPTKSYAQIKGELDTRATTLKASVEDDKKQNLTKYNNQKGVVIAVESAISNYSNIETQLNSLNDPAKITVANGTATAVTPDESQFTQYLPEGSGDPKTTQAYKDAVAANQRAADDYNRLSDNQKAILTKHGVPNLEELQKKKTEEQGKLDELGKAAINGSMDVATYIDAIETINSQIIKLGTEADFNAAVKEIKELHTAYQNALDIQSQENRVNEFNNSVSNAQKSLRTAKRGGKKGLRGWLYDITHKDKKDQRVVQQKQAYTTAKQAAGVQSDIMQGMYERYYSDT